MTKFTDDYAGGVYNTLEQNRKAAAARNLGTPAAPAPKPAPRRFTATYVAAVYEQINAAEATAAAAQV